MKLAMLSSMQIQSSPFRLGVVLLAMLLASCAQNPPAPVEDLSHVVGSQRPPATTPASPMVAPDGTYLVQRGDTVYSIAFRNQVDWRQLASWNRIIAPYTIHPGTQLRLTPPPSWRPEETEPAVVAAAPVFQPVEDVPATAPATATTAPVVTATSPEVPEAVVPKPEVPAAPAAVPAPETTSPGVLVDTGPTRRVDGIAWSWPADGKVLDGFHADDPTRQGLDIDGRAGVPVRAAADGVVVYSGNGLVGYGELIIVKHSDVYLSAYGHNRKRFVNEGERVRAGQQIAELGSSGASRTALHFEIRKQGKPVDPVAFLPAR